MNSTQLNNKEYTLADLVKNLEGVVIQGDPNCKITGIATIHQAKPGQITFLMNNLYKKYLKTTQASAVVLAPSEAESCLTNAIVTRNPYYVYAKIAALFDKKSASVQGIHPTAVIGKNCQIDPSVSIGAFCVIGDNVQLAPNVKIGPSCTIGDFCQIGEASQLDARVTLYHNVRIGKRVIISSGTTIGSDGFGLAKHENAWHKVPQLGGVLIGDDVEIGANCAIDRGAIEDTIIEKGAKLDNLIQVGHNVRIGENTAIAGCVGIAGSAVIGKNCMIGGAAGINGHITIADNVMITGMSGVTKSLTEPGIYSSGLGALSTNREWRKSLARFQRLDYYFEKIKTLETAIESIKESKAT